uniref:C-type lectin domain-containing protein n=1 Tax=Erpetoichthys calabaricus TaxID=27687 RepID=A0A8C4RU58_ERPCA
MKTANLFSQSSVLVVTKHKQSSCGRSSQQYVPYKLTWSNALNYCKVNCSGTLITVENETMNKNLSNCCLNSWIGLRHEYDNWNWSNSDPVTYTNWKRNFYCAVLQSDGSWNDSDCNALNPFLCYNGESDLILNNVK